jgi:hypothetical protein
MAQIYNSAKGIREYVARIVHTKQPNAGAHMKSMKHYVATQCKQGCNVCEYGGSGEYNAETNNAATCNYR